MMIRIDAESRPFRSLLETYLMASFNTFREELKDSTAGLQLFTLFMSYPDKGAVSFNDLKKKLPGLTPAAMSRNRQILEGKSSQRVKEADIVVAESFEDSLDRRNILCQLNDTGRLIREKMHQAGMSAIKHYLEKHKED